MVDVTMPSSMVMAEQARKSTKKHVLVCGGAGFIGTHTVVELIAEGYRVTILDNMDNSCAEAIRRVRQISNAAPEEILVAEADLLDIAKCEIFIQRFGPFDACIHFAGLKAVGESVSMPLHYYTNNILSSTNLVHLLDKYGCHCLVFSSSATVYGDPEFVPITEAHPLRSTNPYGKTKLFVEEILRDVVVSAPNKWSIALLRYFNPIGAHPSGLIGEDPKGPPNNLVPYVSQVAVGRREKLSVFGNDYDTPDGTGVRDYIHVVDLAKGHVASINKALANKGMGAIPYNLGTGTGTSVLEVVKAMEEVSGRQVPYAICDRRPGDIATCFADPSTAKTQLGWEAKIGIRQALADAWKWQSENPNGFKSADDTEEVDGERKCLVFKWYEQF